MSTINLAATAMHAGHLYNSYLYATQTGNAKEREKAAREWIDAYDALGGLLASEVFGAAALLRAKAPSKPRKPAKAATKAKRTRKAA